MINNEITDSLSNIDAGSVSEETSNNLHEYHSPKFVFYGQLAELVQVNPATGSDGGTGDCQHL